MFRWLLLALLLVPVVARAQYFDGLPAVTPTSTSIVPICTGGTSGRPGTCVPGRTTPGALLNVSGSTVYLPFSGGTMTGALHLGANTLDGSAVAFTGGSINGVTVGAATPSTGAFTTLSASGTASLTGGGTLGGNFGGTLTMPSSGTPISVPNGTISAAIHAGTEGAFGYAYLGLQNTYSASGSSQNFPSQTTLWSNANWNGTYTGTGTFVTTQIDIPADTIVASTGSVSYLDITGNVGAGFTGKRSALSAELNITGANGTVSGDDERQWQASIFTTQISANQGGTSPTSGSSAGFVYASGDQMWCNSGATNLSGCVGHEIDVALHTGASSAARLGLSLYSFGEVQGNDRDAAIVIAEGNGATVDWKNGVMFGPGSMNSFITWDRTLTAPTPTYGIDWSGLTFATAAIKLPGGATGTITFAALPTGTAATYACFTSGGALISSASPC